MIMHPLDLDVLREDVALVLKQSRVAVRVLFHGGLNNPCVIVRRIRRDVCK